MTFAGADSLAAAFVGQVRATPDAVAIRDGERELTYRQLDDASGRVAAALRLHGIEAGALVGVSLRRSGMLVAALLGVLRVGAAYVPLDPSYPPERLALIAQDAAVSFVLSEEALHEMLTVAADDRLAPGRDDLAYVIYTSGSTGTPKGVCVTHGNVLSLFAGTDRLFDFGPTDVWTLFHSYSFDFSVWEIFGALLSGGSLVVVAEETAASPRAFLELLHEREVTVLNQVPSVFRYLVSARAQQPEIALALRHVIFGGEAIDRRSIDEWLALAGDDGPALVNMYGITETTVHVTYKRLGREDVTAAGGATPIGRALAHLRVELCDDALEPVAQGAVGEICVLGAGVAMGYLRRPELTEERFVSLGGERAYRSGDLGRRRPDGELEYVGRLDDQVKIRGFRIEPGEVEAALAGLACVADAAVVARSSVQGEPMLVAFLTPTRADAPASAAEIRSELMRVLPRHMIPGRFVVLDELPLGVSGKTDRRELARMALPAVP